jgi:hypothetical protein
MAADSRRYRGQLVGQSACVLIAEYLCCTAPAPDKLEEYMSTSYARFQTV